MNNNNQSLIRIILTRALLAILVMGAMFFIPAGTFAYWEAWVYMIVLFTPMIYVLFYFLKNDPEFLERRMRTKEKESEQKLIVRLALLPFILGFLLPGFDKRFAWSNVPAAVVVAADLVVVLGYVIVIFVFRENRFASRVVEVEQEQTVISSGLYAFVRHPMYLGSILMYVFSPLALGSYWAMIPGLMIIPVLVARIRNEEAVLIKGLPGYQAYTQKTRYRLLPGIW